MSIKHVIGWIVIAAWVTWCSNTPTTIKENTEDIKDSITSTKDTINKVLIKVIDQDTVKPVLKGRHKNHRKINLLEWFLITWLIIGARYYPENTKCEPLTVSDRLSQI